MHRHVTAIAVHACTCCSEPMPESPCISSLHRHQRILSNLIVSHLDSVTLSGSIFACASISTIRHGTGYLSLGHVDAEFVGCRFAGYPTDTDPTCRFTSGWSWQLTPGSMHMPTLYEGIRHQPCSAKAVFTDSFSKKL